MSTAVQLVDALAWPVAVIIVAYLLRREIRAIARAVEGRIKSETTDVSIGPTGLGLTTRVDAIAARTESLEVSQAQVGDVALRALRSASPAESQPAIAEELTRLADEYLAIAIPDWAERVRVKDDYARRLGLMAFEGRSSRDKLSASGNEAYILALASLVILDPKPGDGNLLMDASSKVNRLHVKYYISLALSKLVSARLVTKDQAAEMRKALGTMRTNADEPLRRRIDQTLAQIEVFVNQS